MLRKTTIRKKKIPKRPRRHALAERRAAAVPFVRKAVNAGKAAFASTGPVDSADAKTLHALALGGSERWHANG